MLTNVNTNRHFGIRPNTGADVGEQLTDAMRSYEEKGGILELEIGTYVVSQLKLQPYVWLLGSGCWSGPSHTGSVLWQPEGTNLDCVIADPDAFDIVGGNAWMHNVQMRGFLIQKELNNGTPVDTIGHGVYFAPRMGELFDFAFNRVINFPQDGVYAEGGGKPGWGIHDISVFGNGGYGLRAKGTGGKPGSPLIFRDISGDRNNHALIKLENSGNNTNMMIVDGVAPESREPGPNEGAVVTRVQPYVIECANIHSNVSLNYVTALNQQKDDLSYPGIAMVRLTGSNSGRIHVNLVQGDDWPNLLQDDENTVNIAYDETVQQLMYKSGALRWKLGDAGLVTS